MVFFDVLVLSQCVASACVNEVKTEQRLSSPLIAGSTLQRKKKFSTTVNLKPESTPISVVDTIGMCGIS